MFTHENPKMKTFATVIVVAFLCLVGTGGCVAITYVSVVNRDARLVNAVAAKQEANKAAFDAMWKSLRDQTGIADSYKDAFREIYPQLIKGRYEDNKGLLAKFVTESNPTFDTRLFEKLMHSVEAERRSFLNEQKQLLDLHRELVNLRTTFPGSLVLGGRPPVDVIVVTSDTTEDAFKAGRTEK